MNRNWLEKAMQSRGMTYYQLRYKHRISPDTFTAWENGQAAKPDTLRRLAQALDMQYLTLVKNLGVKVLNAARLRRARAKG